MHFTIGLTVLTAIAAAGLFTAGRVRRTLLPGWAGPPALLADIVLSTTAIVVISEFLGTFGWLRPVPIVVAVAVVIAAVWGWAARSADASSGREGDPVGSAPAGPFSLRPFSRSWPTGLAVLVTGGVVAGWVFRSIRAIEAGMVETEVFRYHMPKAVRFFQDQATTDVLFVDPSQGELIAYYPENSELLHAVGMAFLGSDFLSHLLNLGGVAVVLLAAWTIGRPRGVAWLSVMGAAVVLATPQLLISQAGEATTDLLMVAWLLASVAIVVTGDELGQRATVPVYLVAGGAAGLALGTKYTGLAALLVLVIAALVHAPRGRRARSGAAWIAAMAVSGGYFYVRNLVVVGNPLPAFDLSLGPLDLPSPPTAATTHPLLRVLFDAGAWSDHLVDAFRRSLGQGWWLVLGLCVLLTAASAVRARTPAQRFAVVVTAGSVIGFVVTPQVLGQSLEVLDNVVFNVRYLAHGLVLAFVVAPTILATDSLVARRVIGALYVAVFLLTVVSSDLDRMLDVPDAGWIVAIVLVVGGVILSYGLPTRGRRLAAGGASVLLFLAIAVVGETTQRDDRFGVTRAFSPVHQWAFETTDARIAVTGLPLTYGLNGHDLSNRVRYLGIEGDDGEFIAIADCRDYREAIERGEFTHVVTWPAVLIGTETPVEQTWIETDATLVATGGASSAFAIEGGLDPEGCDSP